MIFQDDRVLFWSDPAIKYFQSTDMLSLSNLWQVQGWRKLWLRDGPLENLWGGGEAEYKKKNSRKGKLNEKNSCTPINPKKYSCYGLKKIHTRNLITKTNSCGSKISLPPHNFSNGPSLSDWPRRGRSEIWVLEGSMPIRKNISN